LTAAFSHFRSAIEAIFWRTARVFHRDFIRVALAIEKPLHDNLPEGKI
jgi:hypothetical protein